MNNQAHCNSLSFLPMAQQAQNVFLKMDDLTVFRPIVGGGMYEIVTAHCDHLPAYTPCRDRRS